MTSEPLPDLTGAVDLAEVAKNAELKKEEQEQREAEAARKRLISWDKKMTRAFKGIVSSPKRHKLLFKAAERHDERPSDD